MESEWILGLVSVPAILLARMRRVDRCPWRIPNSFIHSFIRSSMSSGILVHPVLFFVDHSLAARDFARGPRFVNRARKGPVAENFGPVPSLFGIPMVNDDLDRHDASPDALAFGFIGVADKCQL